MPYDTSVEHHHKRYADDCADCEKHVSKIDYFEKCIELEGDLSEEQIKRLLEIADRCPIHRTLQGDIKIETQLLRDK